MSYDVEMSNATMGDVLVTNVVGIGRWRGGESVYHENIFFGVLNLCSR